MDTTLSGGHHLPAHVQKKRSEFRQLQICGLHSVKLAAAAATPMRSASFRLSQACAACVAYWWLMLVLSCESPLLERLLT